MKNKEINNKFLQISKMYDLQIIELKKEEFKLKEISDEYKKMALETTNENILICLDRITKLMVTK